MNWSTSHFLQFETNLVVDTALISMFQSQLEAIHGDLSHRARRLKLTIPKNADAIEFRLAGTADDGVLKAGADLNQRKTNFGKEAVTFRYAGMHDNTERRRHPPAASRTYYI
jgi:hypothetical protein